MSKKHLHSTVVLLKGRPVEIPITLPPVFTFYCSSIKRYYKKGKGTNYCRDLHSTVVLLKVRCKGKVIEWQINLHSTVVLLKVHVDHPDDVSEINLHSTVVLLKAVPGLFCNVRIIIYILL